MFRVEELQRNSKENFGWGVVPEIVFKKFEVLTKLGQGSFGTIYRGYDRKGKKDVAIKFETVFQGDQTLVREVSIYRRLLKREGSIGIPNLYHYGAQDAFNVLVMESLGPSLGELHEFCSLEFSLKTVLLLVDQLISRIEYIHLNGYVHRDIKPDNFVMGKGDKSNLVYLIDFGLAEKYLLFDTNRHIKKSVVSHLVGSVRYCPVASHNGISQARKEDLESLGYGTLPWQGLDFKTFGKKRKRMTREEKYAIVGKVKQSTSISKLCSGVPSCFRKYFKIVKSMKYEENPKYSELRKLFRKEYFKQFGNSWDYLFEWNSKQVFQPFVEEKKSSLKTRVNTNTPTKKSKNSISSKLEVVDEISKSKERERIFSNGKIGATFPQQSISNSKTVINNSLKKSKSNDKKTRRLSDIFMEKSKILKYFFTSKISKNRFDEKKNEIKNIEEEIEGEGEN